MFSKALIIALLAAVGSAIHFKPGYYGAGFGTYGMPVYHTSAHYGNLFAANPYGYGAHLGRYAGIGALRTGSIIGGGAFGYGTGAYLAGVPAVGKVDHVGVGQLNVARGVPVHQAGPVNAAVHTLSRTVDYTPVPYVGEPPVVQDVDVPPQESPIRINFQSKSSPLAISQQHIPGEPGQVQVTHSEDEPQTAIHNVHRPIIQHVNEVIQPYRTVTQNIRPVMEQTHTNIAQGEGVRLTGLTSGVVGGTGVVAANGVDVVAPALAKNSLIGTGYYGHGLHRRYDLGAGHYGAGYYGTGLYGIGLYGRHGIDAGYYGRHLYGNGLYGKHLIGTGYGFGVKDGVVLDDLSGMTQEKIVRF